VRIKYPPFLTPLLYVTFNLLNLFGRTNVRKIFLVEFITPWLVVSALTMIVYLIVRHLVKEPTRAELLSFIVVVLLTAYGHANIYLADRLGRDVHAFLLPLWGLLLALSVYSTVRSKRNLKKTVEWVRNTAVMLPILGSVLVVAPLFRGGPSANVELDSPTAEEIAAQATIGDRPPDIYYVILDQYGRADILKEYRGYDNGAFIEGLEERGFYVAHESRANYLMTSLSLASSLNMQHVTFLADVIDPDTNGTIVPFRMIRDNKVLGTMDALGYTTIHISSGWEGTKSNPNAEINYRYPGLSAHAFNGLVLETSILNPIYEPVINGQGRRRVLYSIDRLEEISQRPEPTFTFAHFVVPHSPYIFARDGSPAETATSTDAYIDQLTYVNMLALEMVDAILARSDVPPVIIFQSDHGTAFSGALEPANISDELIHERSAIFNAYYLPGGNASLYPDITPVNSFRMVFNTVFNTDLPLVDDTTHVSDYGFPYRFDELGSVN
jgi:hypothetical protein